jgi:hypothetical protein
MILLEDVVKRCVSHFCFQTGNYHSEENNILLSLISTDSLGIGNSCSTLLLNGRGFPWIE